MTLKRAQIPLKTPATRSRALAQIEYALIEMAQKATESSGFEWSVEGTQCRQYGDKREIVIRLAPFGHGKGVG